MDLIDVRIGQTVKIAGFKHFSRRNMNRIGVVAYVEGSDHCGRLTVLVEFPVGEDEDGVLMSEDWGNHEELELVYCTCPLPHRHIEGLQLKTLKSKLEVIEAALQEIKRTLQ